VSREAWGDEGPEYPPWKECEYCSGEPGENSSFYCEECCGMGGHEVEEPDWEDW
jgi:hypothetical protein